MKFALCSGVLMEFRYLKYGPECLGKAALIRASIVLPQTF